MHDNSDPGLRERKKAKTRALIHAQAIRLFHEQGYDATTVEQIAEAAEVSPSTIFRYFPTKTDLVIYDDLDDLMIEQFKAQPRELSTVQALHATLRSVFGTVAGKDLEQQFKRERLIRTVPELRAAILDDFTRTLREMCSLVAERTGRASDDSEVLALAGSVIGIAISAWFASEGEDWMKHYLERIDTGLDLLESGFRL